MKKLMFAAALVSASVAVADQGCTPPVTPTPDPVNSAMVYSMKLSVKTTKGIAKTGIDQAGTAGSQCVPGTDPTYKCVVLRTKDTTTIQGWIYACSYICDVLAKPDGQIFWDSKRKAPFATGAAVTTTFINVMGTKNTEAEWAWTFAGTAGYDTERTQDYTLTGAGLGKFSTKYGRFTSFSGNFAGTAKASFDLKTNAEKYACACDPSRVFACNDLTTLVDSDTVAYGSWTASYNATASKQLLNKYYLTVPSWLGGKFYPYAN